MDGWDEGEAYEAYMGRWSRPIACAFLAWLAVPPARSWLDVGCGTGALTSTIAETARPSRVAGVDPSAGFVAAAKRSLGDGADLDVGDAQSLPFGDDEFDAAVSGLALNFVPDPAAAAAEMRRVTAPGGTVAAYAWDYADGMQLIRTFWDVAVSLDPSMAHLDEATRFPLCDPDRLAALMHDVGLTDVAVTGLEVPTRFPSFDAYWAPLLGGQGPAPSYVVSLSPADRERLRAALATALPEDPDGSIGLTARAWAVKGSA